MFLVQNRDRTATSPVRRNSQVIVINALPAAEGDRDSASSDSGRGPSEDDFSATCSHNTSNSGQSLSIFSIYIARSIVTLSPPWHQPVRGNP